MFTTRKNITFNRKGDSRQKPIRNHSKLLSAEDGLSGENRQKMCRDFGHFTSNIEKMENGIWKEAKR